MRRALMNAAGWVSAKHIQHFQANAELSARVGVFFMRLFNRAEFDHTAASLEQQAELTEIKALSAAFEIKELAENINGWESHHGIGLQMVSSVLMEQTDWEPEDVNDFVDRLSDGFFQFSDVDYYDED